MASVPTAIRTMASPIRRTGKIYINFSKFRIIQVTLQYQRELQQKMGVPAAVAVPPIPVQPPAPLPPPSTQPSPPPPPPETEPNIRSNIVPFDNRPWNRHTGNIAPQIHQDIMSRQQGYQNIAANTSLNQDDASRQQNYQNIAGFGNATMQQDMGSRQQGYQNVGVAGNASMNQDMVARQQGYQNVAPAVLNAQGISQSYDADSTKTKSADVEGEKSAEELAFDEQFRNWENEFIKWKQQNLNHPDRKAYVEYEEKMEQCRTKLLERREQMRRRKIDKNLISEVKTNAMPAQEHLKNNNVISAAILPDQKTERNYGFMTQLGNVENRDDATDYDARYQSHDDTKTTDTRENFMNNFSITSKVTGGIPGLDLIDEKKSPVKSNKNNRRKKNTSSEVYDLEDRSSINSDTKRSNFDEISKGINNILGDPNLVSLLSNINNPANSSNDRNRNNNSSQPDIQNDELNDTQNIRNSNQNEDFQQEPFNKQNNSNTNRYINATVYQSEMLNSRDDTFINQQQRDRFNSHQNITDNRFNNPPNNLNYRFNKQNLQSDSFANQQNNQGEFNNYQNNQGDFNNHQNNQGDFKNKQNIQDEFNIQQNNQGERFTTQQSTPLNRLNNLQNLQGDHNQQVNRFNNQDNRFNQQNNPFDHFNKPANHGDRFRNLQNNNNQNDLLNSQNDRFNNSFGNNSSSFTNPQNMQNANFRNQPDNFQNQPSDFRNDESRNRPNRTNSFPSQNNSPFTPQFDGEIPKSVGNFGNVPFSAQPNRLSHFDDGETSNCSNNIDRRNITPTPGANRFDDFKTDFRRGSVEKNLDNLKLSQVFNAKNPLLHQLPSGSVHSGDRSQDGFSGNDFDDRPFDSKRNFGQFGNNAMQESDCNLLPTKIIDYEGRSRKADELFFKPTQIIDYENPANNMLSTSNSKVVDYGHKAVIGGGASIAKLHGNISKVRIIDYGHQSSSDNLTFKRRIKNERPPLSRKKMKQQFKKDKKPASDVSILYVNGCHSLII